MAKDGTDPTPPPGVLAEIKAVVAKAKAGDAGAVPRLRQFLARYPALWRRYGDVAAQAEMAWIALAAGPDLYLKESLVRFARDQRAALTRPAAPPVERLLVDRAVACWLQLQYFTAVEANALSADEPPRLLQFRARRQAQAQRMYESALAAVVAVQRLLPAAPSRDESAAAADGGRGEGGFAADAAVDLPNRVESFFGRPPSGRRTTGPVPAGASN